MIERVLEEEVMLGSAAQEYDEMDHTSANQAFVEDLLSAVASRDGDSVVGDCFEGVWLDLGTGTAQIPILLCQVQPSVRVIASDLSVDMLDLARYRIEVEGLIERIRLSHDDAKQLEFEDEGFAGVISNSIVHHVAEPLTVLREALRVTAGGGLVFFRDLCRPADEASIETLVQTYAGSESEEAQRLFDESLRAALTVAEMQALVSELGFADDGVKMSSDRHWTWFAQK